MNENQIVQFICPKCKIPIEFKSNYYICNKCNKNYPIIKNIPDFTSEELKTDPMFKSIRRMEFIAPFYEGKLWTNFILRGAGAKNSSIQSIHNYIYDTFKGIQGLFIDVACGPATHGRKIASKERKVLGIDFSMGTLQQGLRNIKRDNVINIQLIRAKADELPIMDNTFNGLINTGALHCFPDTLKTLKEFWRVLNKNAPIVVQTFINGDAPLINRMKKSIYHVFEIKQIEEYLEKAGFTKFEYALDGCLINFTAKKTI
jgi:SAM-dependent methyltransferase